MHKDILEGYTKIICKCLAIDPKDLQNTDAKIMRSSLIFMGMYWLIYENFKTYWYDNFYLYFSNGFERENDEIYYTFLRFSDKKYKSLLKTVKKKNGKDVDKDLSLFRWMVNFGLITNKDYDLLVDIRDVRNSIAHSMASIICKGCNKKQIILLDNQKIHYITSRYADDNDWFAKHRNNANDINVAKGELFITGDVI